MEPLLNLTVRELRSRSRSATPFHGNHRLAFARPAGPPPTDPRLALGQRIYYNSCVYCHGVEGQGQGALLCAKSRLAANDYSTAQILQALQKPVYPMPSLRLIGEEQEAVAAYVRARCSASRPHAAAHP